MGIFLHTQQEFRCHWPESRWEYSCIPNRNFHVTDPSLDGNILAYPTGISVSLTRVWMGIFLHTQQEFQCHWPESRWEYSCILDRNFGVTDPSLDGNILAYLTGILVSLTRVWMRIFLHTRQEFRYHWPESRWEYSCILDRNFGVTDPSLDGNILAYPTGILVSLTRV